MKRVVNALIKFFASPVIYVDRREVAVEAHYEAVAMDALITSSLPYVVVVQMIADEERDALNALND
jgi:hypothetical protein